MPIPALLAALLLAGPSAAADAPSVEALLRTAVTELVAMQESDGGWPYEGVYRVGGEIPLGYRVGGTAIVAGALRRAAPDSQAATAAIERGLSYILSKLDDPLLAPSTRDAYDVRVWGHCYVLEFFCQLRDARYSGTKRDEIEKWIPRLVEILIQQELSGGGWNYANRRSQACFVTAPVVQTLLLAQSQGAKVPDEIFSRARDVLRRSRFDTGAFLYSGVRSDSEATSQASQPASAPAARRAALPGSVARSAICEVTLALLGEGSPERIQRAVDAFHAHWDELEKRRRKTGTHEGPYGIAPYYFYYGHRYAAQAIEFLPREQRAAEREKLLRVILRTRDDDGTWNDRVFPRSRNFGTAMIVLALLGEQQPMPPRNEKR